MAWVGYKFPWHNLFGSALCRAMPRLHGPQTKHPWLFLGSPSWQSHVSRLGRN